MVHHEQNRLLLALHHQQNCLLLALHQRALGRDCCVPPELFEPLVHSFVDPAGSLRALCRRNALAVLQQWHATFGIHAARESIVSALAQACFHGWVPVAAWLQRTFNITGDEVASLWPDGMFRPACFHGHLEVVQWLHRTFHLSPTHVRALDNAAFRVACSQGRLQLAQWLHTTFHLTAKDAGARNNLAMVLALAHGHTDVVRWLGQTFGMTLPAYASQIVQ